MKNCHNQTEKFKCFVQGEKEDRRKWQSNRGREETGRNSEQQIEMKDERMPSRERRRAGAWTKNEHYKRKMESAR